HARHVDVGQYQAESRRGRAGDTGERSVGVRCELHHEAAGSERTAEVLAEQYFDVGPIVDDEDEGGHGRPPPWAGAAARGSTIRNSVYSPGSVSTSMVPPCCLTMIS